MLIYGFSLACEIWLDEDYYGSHIISNRIENEEEVWCYTALVQPSEEWWEMHNWTSVLQEKYPSVWLLDYPPMNYRIYPWICHHYGWVEKNPWLDAGTYHENNYTYNGGGSLFISGKNRGNRF